MKKTNHLFYRKLASSHQTAGHRISCLVTDAFLAALLLLLQAALAALPNIEIVSLLVILYTLLLGKRVFLILSVFSILEGILYGFGLWLIAYLYVWPVLACLVFLLKRFHAPDFVYAIFSGCFGLSFGFLCSLPYVFAGFSAMISQWISGLSFDLLHGISNFILTLILLKPLRQSLRLCLKYQFTSQNNE